MENFKPIIKILAILICSVALILVGYIYRDYVSPVVLPIINKIESLTGIGVPCARPITFRIGDFDEKFGKNKQEFLNDIEKAASIWEESIDKDLFKYSDNGELEINLVYDYRQKATNEMAGLSDTIKDKRSTYDSLKNKYDQANYSYKAKRSEYDAKMTTYLAARKAYEEKVAYWKKVGNVTESTASQIETERQNVNALGNEVNLLQSQLNTLAKSLNSIAASLNQIARNLNVNVREYNNIGASTGPEFDEGEYIRDENGTRINIYQFENDEKLIRVLSHELGHALGMGHVDDKTALMYIINQSTGLDPTQADLNELKTICQIK